jgi:hypothetical protein
MEALNILYVGDVKNSTILPAFEGQAMTPETAREALAMYVLYFPEIVVLEGCSEMVREVFYHLSSGVTETSPLFVEAMLVIDDGVDWQTPSNTILKQLPANASAADALRAVEDLTAVREALRIAEYARTPQIDLNLAF